MFESVRARLTIWYTGVLALVLVVFAITVYLLLAQLATQRTDSSLAESADSFAAISTSEQSDERAGTGDNTVVDAVREFRFVDRSFKLYDKAHRIVAASDSPGNERSNRSRKGAQIPTGPVPASLLGDAERLGKAYATLPEVGGDSDGFRAFSRPIKLNGREYIIVVMRSLHDQDEMLGQLRLTLFVSIPLALLVAGLGGYFLARRSLAPVTRMSDKAARIGAANLHERLPVSNEGDELGRLAQVFNDLLARLSESFEQQRRFMADASHELRTPVAVVRGESEVILSRAERTPEDYRESLEIVHDEGRRLTRIVEDLFTLARADAGQYQIHESEFDFDEVVGDSVRAMRTLAAKRKVEVRHESSGELPFTGDELLIRHMIINLLDNAIKYTQPGGRVNATSMRHEAEYVVTIADTGTGIPLAARPHIFERFYRVDSVRGRGKDIDLDHAGSGAGLGLSIAHWIAEAHHGRLELTRSSDAGSTFVATFPAP